MIYPTSEREVEELLSTPTEVSVRAMSRLDGDLLVLGAGGKMGPSLARLALRSSRQAGRSNQKVIAVSRFTNTTSREQLEANGISTIAMDLTDPTQRSGLPNCDNVLIMLGHKFGAADPPGMYWGMNTLLPGQIAEQFRDSRVVCFSSGNVYPFVGVTDSAPTESAPVDPLGDYATTVVGREGVLQYVSSRFGTPVLLVRLNYAVEQRYGVLVDLAQQLRLGTPIDLDVPELNFVWQGHANAVTLACFDLATSPADILNVTGVERHRVRELAEGLGHRLNIKPTWGRPEGDRSLVSDAQRCRELFGDPEFGPEQMLDMIAEWMRCDGRTLGKPTRFQTNNGKF